MIMMFRVGVQELQQEYSARSMHSLPAILNKTNFDDFDDSFFYNICNKTQIYYKSGM
jgi:hypothetical protein